MAAAKGGAVMPTLADFLVWAVAVAGVVGFFAFAAFLILCVAVELVVAIRKAKEKIS